MTKKEIIKLVAKKTNYKQKEVSDIVEATMDEIMDAVTDGKKVVFVNFGIFEPKKKATKKGVNISNGEPLIIPSKNVPAFRPGKEFKTRLR